MNGIAFWSALCALWTRSFASATAPAASTLPIPAGPQPRRLTRQERRRAIRRHFRNPNKLGRRAQKQYVW